MNILPIIPVARMDRLVAAHGDGGGPGGAAAAAVGDDIEDGRVELGAAAVVCGEEGCLAVGRERGCWAWGKEGRWR